MNPRLIPLASLATFLALPVGAQSLTVNGTTIVSNNGSGFDFSVFPGTAGFEGSDGTSPTSGTFGDGTVIDYRFFQTVSDNFTSYADGGAGLITGDCPPENNGGNQNWMDLWTVTDPAGFTSAADFTSTTIASSAEVNGTIDISSLTDGNVYFLSGVFRSNSSVTVTMSGPGQPDIEVTDTLPNPGGTNRAWVSDFAFSGAANYLTLTYRYFCSDRDGSAARFGGIVLDGEANTGPDDTDSDFILDLWEDEFFGDNSGTVEPSDLTPTDGTGDQDGDGATDRQEFNNGSNPLVKDTDGDGVEDGPEINTFGSDPDDPDSDGDGLTDGDEVNDSGLLDTDGAITDPTNPDSDGDNLTDGDEANSSGPLDTDGFITNPNNTDSDNDGVQDDIDGLPNDGSNDTDLDGLSNDNETNSIGSDPLVKDTDGDTIEDGDEVNDSGPLDNDGFVTDPLNVDTDSDEIKDAEELALGTDPTDRESVPTTGPAGLTFGDTTGIWNQTTSYDLSVFDGKAGYAGLAEDGSPTAGNFGDGTVLDFRFFANDSDSVTTVAVGTGGIVTEATAAPENIAGQQSWGNVWTVSDPGTNFDTTPDFSDAVNTMVNAANITGTIDISGLESGTFYLVHGTFVNAWNINIVMSGDGQPDVNASTSRGNGPGTNFAWVSGFAFFNAADYDTITYTYTNTDSDGSRARFKGVIVDGVALPPMGIVLEVAEVGGGLDFSWNSSPGMQYDLLSSTDPETEPDPSMWAVYNDGVTTYEDLAASGTGTTMLNGVLRNGAKRLFVIREEPIPPLLDESFDAAGPALPVGWVASNATTGWDVGDPTGVPGLLGDDDTNCVGTNVGALYADENAVITLTSPAVAIPVGGATLTFRQYIDSDISNGEAGSIRLLDATDTEIVEGDFPIVDIDGVELGWTDESVTLPASAAGQNVKIVFEYSLTTVSAIQYHGFLIDDVVITAN